MTDALTLSLPRQRPPAARQMKQAFSAALLLEVAAVCGALVWLNLHPKVPVAAAVALQFEAPPPLTPPEPVPPKPMPPPPKPKAVVEPPKKSLSPPPPAPMPAPAPAPLPVTAAPSENPLPAPSPAPVAATPLAKPPPPQAAAPAGPAKPSNEYIDKVRNAVQTAFVYPPAARAMEFRGRARVAFNLLDGQASNARLVVKSGLSMGDRAALEAVQTAAFPLPPVDLKGVEMPCEVWVELR